MPTTEDLDRHFPRYERLDPRVPIWCVTPGPGGGLHRFFDTPPVSPSGRYLAVLRMPTPLAVPAPGDSAEVVVVDLQSGGERVVAETRGWETQLGANVNWGGDDATLLFNDVEPGEWVPYAVRLDPHTGQRQRLAGTVYHAAPDGRTLASADLTRMGFTQPGYGVVVPEPYRHRQVGPADDDGLWLTDVPTNTRRLAVSARRLVDVAGPAELKHTPDAFEVYGFHAKWNPAGDRLIFTLRWFPAGATPDRDAFAAQIGGGWKVRFAVYTLRPDGSDIRLAVGPEYWEHRGHHINFTPEGRGLTMNLGGFPSEHVLSLVRCDLDGRNLRPITDAVAGSGHPSLHPCGNLLIDAYAEEKPFYDEATRTTPLRWVDPERGTDTTLARVDHHTGIGGGPLRLDPHPAWDRSWRWAFFNASDGGVRRVYLADLGSLTGLI